MEQVQLAAIKRDTGKTSARRLREQGYLPAVLYGQDVDSLPLAVMERFIASETGGPEQFDQFAVSWRAGHNCDDQDLQQDRLRNRCALISKDFFEGQNPDGSLVASSWREAISKQGLLLQQQIRAVLVECLPTEIPNAIEVNVADLTAGDSVTVGQLQVPEGVTVLADPDEVICSVIVPRVETVEDEPEAGEEAEGQEAAETPDSEEK